MLRDKRGETTWRCHENAFIGALGIQQPLLSNLFLCLLLSSSTSHILMMTALNSLLSSVFYLSDCFSQASEFFGIFYLNFQINNPKIRKAVLEGDKLMKEVLNGGYNVHPVPPPNSEIKERITKRYERERIKIEKLLTLGYTTSGDPRKIGTK